MRNTTMKLNHMIKDVPTLTLIIGAVLVFGIGYFAGVSYTYELHIRPPKEQIDAIERLVNTSNAIPFVTDRATIGFLKDAYYMPMYHLQARYMLENKIGLICGTRTELTSEQIVQGLHDLNNRSTQEVVTFCEDILQDQVTKGNISNEPLYKETWLKGVK